MPSPNEITSSQLLRLIGTPAAPQVVDVCLNEDFAEDQRLIPGSTRHAHTNMDGLIALLTKDRPVVIVCQKGKKLSQGVAALLRNSGFRAEYLQAGIFGWRDFGGPMVPFKALPALVSSSTLWVTRHRPKIDRIACPWLIRRFVDPSAQFMFVAPAVVENVATVFGATPFDVENVFWSHRGENCTFDTMLAEFHLETAPLTRMAQVIRAADTNTHNNAPEAAGLLAISVGLSCAYRDDVQQMEAGLHIYDALYRWARDGTSETHDWPNTQSKAK